MYGFSQRVKIVAILGAVALVLAVAHTLVKGVPADQAFAVAAPECTDGLDNDVDGQVDYPEDTDCDSPGDPQEGELGQKLFISLSDGFNEVENGGAITYTIALRTTEDDPQLIDVRFFLPELVSFINASESGRKEGAAIVWNDVYVQPQYVKNLNVTVRVNQDVRDGIILYAEVTADGERASDTTQVKEEEFGMAPLEIFVDDGRVYAEPMEELHYKIIVKNQFGPDRNFSLYSHIPPFLSFLDASGGYKRDNRSVEWHDQFIANGETLVYDLLGVIERNTPEFSNLRLRVSSDAALGTDTTSILYEQIPPAALDLSIDDGQSTAVNGQELTYLVRISNNQGKLLTGVDIKNGLPIYTEFVSATEGGYWTGKEVHWKDITISPFGSRTLQVTLRVRSDAPLGAQLRHSVRAAGREAVDVTEVSTSASGQRNVQPVNNSRLLRKVSDRTEVRPGDTVNYTIYVQNTLENPVRNVRIEDRMDSRFSTVLNAEYGQMQGDRIVWDIPQLDPGQKWQVTYAVRVDPNVPHGTEIANVVTISGEGMESVSLTQRTYTTRIGVVTQLPRSGAPLDVIFAGIMAFFSGFPTMWIRRRSLVWLH
ncbi:DUF11 domain-containing protein [Patescibacteria group bacterium]|nr:DUF11 domain-containing protein [Patescibacteria group bacterium]